MTYCPPKQRIDDLFLDLFDITYANMYPLLRLFTKPPISATGIIRYKLTTLGGRIQKSPSHRIKEKDKHDDLDHKFANQYNLSKPPITYLFSPSGLSPVCFCPPRLDTPLCTPCPALFAVLPTPSVAPETVCPRPDVALPTVEPSPPTVLPTVFVTPPTVLPKVSPSPPRSPAIDVWLVRVRVLGLVYEEHTVLLVGHGGYVEEDVWFVCCKEYVIGSVGCFNGVDQDYGRVAGLAVCIYTNATLQNRLHIHDIMCNIHYFLAATAI